MTTPAIFLSYAREDAPSARRIAEALRAAGLEVWFDENELRGGDAWDAKIRQQIDACTLFLPIISAHTQERSKGYFRLEWKLAVEQTHLMAEGVAYLAPVVIDDTPEAGALVPAEFLKVQWTRLPGALPTPQFVAQIKRLLAQSGAAAPVAARPAPGVRSAAAAAPAPGPSRLPRFLLGGVASVALAAAAFWALRPRPAPPTAPASTPPVPTAAAPAVTAADSKSIAVLPFANMSADKENEFFADGMHDDLITALAKVRDLKVISRTSVLAYRDTAARNLRKIAGDLGVAAILEGSVQRAGNRVRINLQLIDARTDAHLWAETYNRELNDIFAIQAELVQQVSAALKAKLTAGEQDLLARRPTENQQAYDLYLRARILDQALQVQSSREEYERIAALYEQAGELDPAFTFAHVQASIAHGTMFWFAALDPTPARRDRAWAALQRARALAPGSPEVLLAEGSFEYACNNSWSAAIDLYRRAEASLPNDAQLQYRMALTHRRLGEMADALTRLERSVALNPNDARGLTTLIETLMVLRRYPEAAASIERHRELLISDYNAQRSKILAQQELTGDRAAFLRGLAILPALASDPHGLNAAYIVAMAKGDYAAAAVILQDPRLKVVRGSSGVVNEPVSLHRARVAWLLQRPEEARRYADEAIRYYRESAWTPRQQPAVQLCVGRAEAFAGRFDAALREARAGLVAQEALDGFNLRYFHHWLGEILIVAGRPEEALAELRRIVAAPDPMSPGEYRHDPIWSRLKSDPRFEQILRSAKRL